MKRLFAVSVLVVIFSMCTYAQNADMIKKLKGTWNYTSYDAPYNYQKGKVIFYKDGEEFKVKLDINGYKIQAKDLKINENNVQFSIYVENELVAVKLTLKDNKIKGKAETYDGDLDVTLEKEKA